MHPNENAPLKLVRRVLMQCACSVCYDFRFAHTAKQIPSAATAKIHPA